MFSKKDLSLLARENFKHWNRLKVIDSRNSLIDNIVPKLVILFNSPREM